MKEPLPIHIKGHLKIEDDLGNILVDKDNAIHPENMSRVIARALSNENNFFIHRMGFGNGGTVVDAAQQVTFNDPNNGVNDGVQWKSTLYNETYSEVINENINVGGAETENPDFGSGAGTNPSGDPSFTAHNVDGPGVVSRPVGTLSEVRIQVTINAGEPSGQFLSESSAGTNTESAFMFDEIGLFTSGRPLSATAGYQDVDIGQKTLSSDTGLLVNTDYVFQIGIDGSSLSNITFNTGAGTGGIITYTDLLSKINAQLPPSSSIAELGNSGATYVNHQKFRFRSLTTGAASEIELGHYTATGSAPYPLFAGDPGAAIPGLLDFNTLENPVMGEDAGVQNDALNPDQEGERMLTHVIFNPVLKTANRTLTINYTLTVSLI